MTKKKKKQWLRAIRKLREHYKKYELGALPPPYAAVQREPCPLCVVANVVTDENCDCLWTKFEGNTCRGKCFSGHVTRTRLDRLNRWEELLEGE